MKQMTKTSPRAKGRITGAFYLAIFVAGVIYMALVPSTGLLNNNDAAAIDYIVSHQTAFWAGYPFLLLVVVFRLIVMLLFYELFKPVNKSISLLAVYFNIAATTMQAVMCIFLLTPLILLVGEHYLTGDDRRLRVKLELPDGPVEMWMVPVRYESLEEDEVESGYVIGARITQMSEAHRARFEEYIAKLLGRQPAHEKIPQTKRSQPNASGT